MRQNIPITYEESTNVENLFYKYNAYMAMLEYFANSQSSTELYNKKWDEAAQIQIELTKAKQAIENKYKPLGDWDSFEFDFDKKQVIFIK